MNAFFQNKIGLLALFFSLGFIFITPTALAQQGDPCDKAIFGCFEVLDDILSSKFIYDYAVGETPLITIVNVFVKIILGVIVGMTMIALIIGGYLYMTAGGDGMKVSTAKKVLLSALGGLVLAFAAWLILNTISPQFTSNVQEPTLNTP